MTRAADISQQLLAADAPHARRGVRASDALRDLLGRMARGEPIIETVETGIAIFDETTGGLVRGEYLGIAAAPGVGKSLLADRLSLQVLQRDPEATALVFNLETATPVRVARLLCGAAVRVDDHNAISASLSLTRLLRGIASADEQRHALAVSESLADDLARLTYIDDCDDGTDIADLIRAERPTVVVIDHLGLVTAESIGSASDLERSEIALQEILGALRETRAAGVLIAEFNKAGMSRNATELFAIRGSARFASLAGMVLTIAEEPADNDDEIGLRLELLKNRHGRSMFQQRATLFGGIGHVYFGETSRIQPSESRGAK